MPANLTRIMGEVPRPLEIAERDYSREGPIDRRRLKPAEVARNIEPLIGRIASGDIPLDDHAAKAIALYVEEHHKHATGQ